MALQMPAMQALGKELGVSLENGVAGVANDVMDVVVEEPKKPEVKDVPEVSEGV